MLPGHFIAGAKALGCPPARPRIRQPAQCTIEFEQALWPEAARKTFSRQAQAIADIPDAHAGQGFAHRKRPIETRDGQGTQCRRQVRRLADTYPAPAPGQPGRRQGRRRYRQGGCEALLLETGRNLLPQVREPAVQPQAARNLQQQDIRAGKTNDRRKLFEPAGQVLERLLLSQFAALHEHKRR